MELPSTKPYLIRALHQWCSDNGFTPYIAVLANAQAKVPLEFVRDGQIVLNISHTATGHLEIGNERISFQARIGGVARNISVPIGNVLAIYAKENGAGMAFEAETGEVADDESAAIEPEDHPEPPTSPVGRPKLQRVK